MFLKQISSFGIALGVSFVAPPATQAQSSLSFGNLAPPRTVTSSDYGLRSGSLIVAPVPFSNPMIGSGLALGGGYLFTLPGSKPSGFGVGKMKSSNGSSGLAAGGALSFAEGRWSISALSGEAEVYYDLVFKDVDIPIKHSGTLATIGINRASTDRLSFGIGLEYLETQLAVDSPVFQELPDILKPQTELDLVKVTMNATYDTRDNTFYPTSGVLTSAKLGYALEVSSLFQGRLEVGQTRYSKGIISLASYNRLGEAGVLAARGILCSASSRAPFFDSCGIGMASGLRGFPTTEYIDEASATAQIEYRGRLNERFGYVAFAAVGGGGSKITSVSLNEGGFALGVGARIRLSKKYKLDYAIDYARNDKGNEYLYISLGQKF